MTTNANELRALVARSCNILGRQGLTREPAGHVSARLPDGRVLIKGRGPEEAALSYTTADDLIVVDMNGQMVEGRQGLAAPNEVFIHTWVLKTRPEFNSVIHIHPPTVVAFTIANRPLLPVVGAFNPGALRLVLEDLPTYPRSHLISSEERGEALAKTMASARACLMVGHGITTAGRTVQEATLTALNLNDLAEMNYKAALLGTPQPIPAEDMKEFKAQMAHGGNRPAPAYGDSTWRYYDWVIGK